mgnify:CR=1 FL=1
MSHGPKSAGYDFCKLYSQQQKAVAGDSQCPNLAVTLVPN